MERALISGEPSLIGLDWGTSRVRAYLFNRAGGVIDTTARPWGVLNTPDNDFPAAFHRLVTPWRTAAPGITAIAAGMIGSALGWVRAPYAACPAGVPEFAASLVSLATGADGELHVIGGVEQLGAAADVMRGEETQVAGALALEPRLRAAATFVLPGTHSKWVDVRDGRIERFTTFMTGELYAVLSEHSILGRPARDAGRNTSADAAADSDAFDRGVATVFESGARGIAPLLFRTRSLVLAHALRAGESLEFLSGMLVGDEVRAALHDRSGPLTLLGEPALCGRYRRALTLAGVHAAILDAASPAGLWSIANAAGLVPAAAARG